MGKFSSLHTEKGLRFLVHILEKGKDLSSIIVNLKAVNSGKIPAGNGYLVHAGVLSYLEEIEGKNFSEILHGNKMTRLWTLSALHGKSERSGNIQDNSRNMVLNSGQYKKIQIKKDHKYWIRITFLKKDIGEIVLKAFQKAATLIRLGPTREFKVTEYKVHGVIEHNNNLAGTENYSDLISYCAKLQSPLPRKILFRFDSATAHRGVIPGQNFLYPLPKVIFPALARRFKLLSPISIREFQAEDFEEQLMVSAYLLETNIVHFGTANIGRNKKIEKKQIGYSGYWEIMANKKADEELLRIVQLLGRFAFFDGIGYQTSRGMGQVEFFSIGDKGDKYSPGQ